MRKAAPLALLFLLTVAGGALSQTLVPGRYEGALDVGGGLTTPIVLRLLADGGGLVDLPGQDLFSYPLSGLVIEGGRMAFTLGEDAADGSSAALRFDAEVRDKAAAPLRLFGRYSKGGQGSTFYLVSSPRPRGDDRAFPVKVRAGFLRGSLLVPAGPGPFPLVVIVGGAGATDRDGNNYNVPGRNDGVKALAVALRSLGVATYRYDKRGAGESYVLGGREEDGNFDDYVDDAVAVVKALRQDRSFSRLVVAGHTEGGLVAAAAVNRLKKDGIPVEGLVLLCATGRTAVETVEIGLADTPEELKPEARAIMDSLKAGKPWPEPSEYFAGFFRPSLQPWLISWFKYNIKTELGAWKAPLLLVQGNHDFQVSLAEFAILAAIRPDAPAFVLPGMNHVLKDVPAELDENYKAFSDPSFELSPDLAPIMAAFAKGSSLPVGLPRFDGGTMRN